MKGCRKEQENIFRDHRSISLCFVPRKGLGGTESSLRPTPGSGERRQTAGR
jgi:hypothetical protein